MPPPHQRNPRRRRTRVSLPHFRHRISAILICSACWRARAFFARPAGAVAFIFGKSTEHHLERSLKEAASELEARLKSQPSPPFPGDGAARRRQCADAARGRVAPCSAQSSRSPRSPPRPRRSQMSWHFSSASRIDADVPSRRVHLLRGWELKPFAAISPPPDVQASQLAALSRCDALPRRSSSPRRKR